MNLADEVARVMGTLMPMQPCARTLYPLPPMTPAETAQAEAEFFDVEEAK